MRKPERILLWDLMVTLFALGQAWPNKMLSPRPSSGLKTDCVANLMRLTLDEALAVGNQLEVEALNGTQYVLLTPSLAAQCGYSMESDPWGNTRIYSSLMGCFVDNKDDMMFGVGLKLKIYRHSPEVVSHDVAQTCSYTRWAPREILCDRNYMEVSTYMAPRYPQAEGKGQDGKDSQINEIPSVSEEVHGIWKITFFTPEPMSMVLKEAQQAGYSATTTSTRVVMRGPLNTAETYSEDVAGVPMEVLKVSIYHKAQDGLNVFNLAAACPTGGVLFTEDLISWHIPRRVTPLLDGSIRLVEMNMGINGQRLDKAQMTARGYYLSTTDFHIIVEIPVGSPDGYYKSHAPDFQYHITYTIEPMLEVLWRADQTQQDTNYKILFPITTPPMPHPSHTDDRTNPEMREFSLVVGTFLHDVELRNITFATGVLSVDESNARGFTVQQHVLANGTTVFLLKVPFDSDVVYKHNPEVLVTTYTLNVVFGFVIMPEESPFAHPVELQASLQDVVLPTLSGTCDQDNFYITVKYGNQGNNFKTMIGGLDMTPELAEAYNFNGNATQFSIAVPYAATGSAFELITTVSVRARLDVLVWDPITNWILADFFLACYFPLLTTTCYPNGTISALAVKVESVPNLDPSWLTLRDQACGPAFSNDRFAQFIFSADSCGTTRTFFDHYMMYENEIWLYYNGKGVAQTSPVDPEYRQTVSCYYVVNDTQTIDFHATSRLYEPKAEIGSGQMIVQMRLAKDSSYQAFYDAEDYPVEKYLREPLNFEVELVQSTDPHLELLLDNCWATLQKERTSLPSWDIIVNSCTYPGDSYATVFSPVSVDNRISVPSHYKRFSIKMFAFIQEEQVLKNEVYIHCDLVICDTTSPREGICQGQCVNQGVKGTSKQTRRGRSTTHQKQISSGPIVMNNFQ